MSAIFFRKINSSNFLNNFDDISLACWCLYPGHLHVICILGPLEGRCSMLLIFQWKGKRERNKWFAPLPSRTAGRIVNVAVAHEVDHVTTPSLSLDIGDVIIDHLSLPTVSISLFFAFNFISEQKRFVSLVDSLTWTKFDQFLAAQFWLNFECFYIIR